MNPIDSTRQPSTVYIAPGKSIYYMLEMQI